MTAATQPNRSERDIGGFRVFDGKGIILKNGAQLINRTPSIMDHFAYGAGAFNSHVPQNWVTTETGAATPFAPGATGITVATAVTGGTTNNAEELAGKNVAWVPSTMALNQFILLEVRAKFVGTTTPADGDFYIGMANAVTYTNSLPYVVSAASALTTSAPVEFAGFGYSSIPSSGALFNSGGNNFIGIFTEISSVAPAPKATSPAVVKDSLYHIYRVVIDSGGNAAFYIDDAFVGSTIGAVTAATALVPYINVVAKNSHTHTATIDYIYVGADVSA